MARSERAGCLTGFLTGSLVGAGLALLLVPQTGEETRDLLRAKLREASNRARDTADDIYSKGRDALDQARAAVDEAVEEGNAAANEQREQLRHEVAGQGSIDGRAPEEQG